MDPTLLEYLDEIEEYYSRAPKNHLIFVDQFIENYFRSSFVSLVLRLHSERLERVRVLRLFQRDILVCEWRRRKEKPHGGVSSNGFQFIVTQHKASWDVYTKKDARKYAMEEFKVLKKWNKLDPGQIKAIEKHLELERRNSLARSATTSVDPMNLWARAYKEVESRCPRAIEYFERMCIERAEREVDEASVSGCIMSPSNHDLIEGLLVASKDRLAEQQARSEDIAQAIEIVLSVKSAATAVITAVSAKTATVPWLCLCYCLERIQSEQAQEAARLRRCGDEIVRIVRRMKWYTDLWTALFTKTRDTNNIAEPELGEGLRQVIVDLYASLLEYTIKFLCEFNESIAYGPNDWDELLENVNVAEQAAEQKIQQFERRQCNTHLEFIVEFYVSTSHSEIMRALVVDDVEATLKSLERSLPPRPLLNTEQFRRFASWHGDGQQTTMWLVCENDVTQDSLLVTMASSLLQERETHFGRETAIHRCATPAVSTSTQILRGLIWMLLEDQPLLMTHVEKPWKKLGRRMLDSDHAFERLYLIFKDIVGSEQLQGCTLVVSGLHACASDDLARMLEVVRETGVSWPDKVRWIVLSQDRPVIKTWMEGNSAIIDRSHIDDTWALEGGV